MEQMTPFINYAKHVSAHGYKLVCLHHAGAGASAYLKWQNVFGDRLEVLPVQLPGHETRMREQPFSSCTEATDAVVQALQPYLETVWVAFWHMKPRRNGFEWACVRMFVLSPPLMWKI